ncbi:MAG TPA: STM4015 family protein [Blastocatellia bacterium]|nr:STM4015 family protein [Blastocatellia bacterium]
MAINEHITEFVRHPVTDWDAEEGILDPHKTFYRIAVSYDEQEEGIRWEDKFKLFLNDPRSHEALGLVIGDWGLFDGVQDSASVVEALVSAHDRLANLKAIFLGDITYEECEISWLEHCDISPLFSAYPQLEHFCVRGANNLSFGKLEHNQLKTLIIQSGGLGVSVINEILTAQLPQLEHLELWLGVDNYGGNATVNDLQLLLSGNLFPNLTYLGLRDSEIADDIAKAITTAPVLNQIKTLDLSMGTLGDEGAEALLASPLISKLEKLDIHHHFCSESVIARFAKLGIEVDTSEPQKEHSYGNESYRYVAVSE